MGAYTIAFVPEGRRRCRRRRAPRRSQQNAQIDAGDQNDRAAPQPPTPSRPRRHRRSETTPPGSAHDRTGHRQRAGDDRHHRPQADAGGRPGRGLRHPAPAADVGHPEADAADRRPADDRARARATSAGTASTEAVLSLGFLPDAFASAYPDGTCAGLRLHYAVEPEPLDTAGAIRFAARDAGIDERFVVVNGDVLTDLDVTRAGRVPREPATPRRTIALHRVDDPSAYGVVPTDADGRVRGVRREAAPGTAPDRPDQRRHLRARAVGARPHPRRAQGVDRARDLPGDRRRRPPVRAGRRHLLDRHRHARRRTCRRSST